jgi:DNA invertase Pin-like site-specific DNA recombinase
MRVAIYARVSTDDKGQDPENQLRELRAWCINSGHVIFREYVEHESDRKGADRRKQFAALFVDAAKRKFDCVLFWALDRFSREGMAQTIAHLQRLVSYGVAFHSYTEPHLATDNELVRNILLALLSSLAKLEAQKISERTKSGMARAKANGINIGRPKLAIEIRQKIAQRAAKGETPYAIAKALRIDRHCGQVCAVACLSGDRDFGGIVAELLNETQTDWRASVNSHTRVGVRSRACCGLL